VRFQNVLGKLQLCGRLVKRALPGERAV